MTKFSVIGGTGALGKALTLRLAGAGHEVWIGSRDAQKAQDAAQEVAARTGGRVQGMGIAEAAAQGEICFLAIPYAAHGSTLTQLRPAVQGKIVVDTTAPLKPPKVGTVQLPQAGCAAVETAQALGADVFVVSALQTIGAEKLAAGGAIDGDVLVAGDHGESVETVRGILGEMGLRSWHVGPLANSAAAEAMTSVLIQLNRRYKLGQAGLRITGQGAAKASAGLTVKALPGLPMFGSGDDLAGAIAVALTASGERLVDGDVLVIAQKAVSKVEGRMVALTGVTPRPEAVEIGTRTERDPAVMELVLQETQEMMRVTKEVVVTRHHSGHVLANAGIDVSNVKPDNESSETVLLWPADVDASAQALRSALQSRFDVRIAVIVSDSLGRAWRIGTIGHAIGVAGMRPLRDRRGEMDLFGRELKATMIGVADEIAAAASLVIGEGAEGTPVALVRGATYVADEEGRAADLLRPLEHDLFR